MAVRLVAALFAVGSAGLMSGPRSGDALRRQSHGQRIRRESVAVAPDLAKVVAPPASLVAAQAAVLTTANVADTARGLTQAEGEATMELWQKAALAVTLTLLGVGALFLLHPAPSLGTRRNAFDSTALVAGGIAAAAAAHFLGGPAGVRRTVSTIFLILLGVMNLLIGVPKFRHEWTPEGWRHNVRAHYFKLHQPWWAGILFISLLLVASVTCLVGALGAMRLVPMPDSEVWRWIAIVGGWGMGTIYMAGATCHTFYDGMGSEGPPCGVMGGMALVAAALRAPEEGLHPDEALAYFAVTATCAIFGGGWLFLVPKGPVPKCLQEDQ